MEVGWIVALCGGFSTVSAAGAALLTKWWESRRLVRQDEVSVLHQAVDDRRKDVADLKQEMKEIREQHDLEVAKMEELRSAENRVHNEELKALKDEHTKCLLKQERQQGLIDRQLERIQILEEKAGIKHANSSSGERSGSTQPA